MCFKNIKYSILYIKDSKDTKSVLQINHLSQDLSTQPLQIRFNVNLRFLSKDERFQIPKKLF